MNDSEIRRRELLRQTRRLYDERREAPAVHPRYGNIYRSLYEDNPDQQSGNGTGGSFYIRLLIGILCFAGFVYMDQNRTSVANVDSVMIIDQIEKEIIH